MNGQMRGVREKILQSVQKKDYRALFMEGGWQFYALVLQEQLGLPLFYVSFPGHDDHSHVFAMKDGACFDYDGKKELAFVAEKYAGWPDEPARPVAPEKIREVLRQRGIADLEPEVMRIARSELAQRRSLYD
jgi:hypothetical protein